MLDLSSRVVNDLVCFALTAFFPRVDDLPGLAELDVDARIVAFRRGTTLFFWAGIVLAAVVFQITPVVTVRRPFPAVFLGQDELDAHANALAEHPVYLVRQLILLLKLVGGLFWAQSDEIRAHLRLPPYPADPGTRRTQSRVPLPVLALRAPLPSLIAIGRREQELGRGRDSYDVSVGKHR